MQRVESHISLFTYLETLLNYLYQQVSPVKLVTWMLARETAMLRGKSSVCSGKDERNDAIPHLTNMNKSENHYWLA